MLFSALAAGVLAAFSVGASETTKEGASAGKCPAAEKVSALLGSWKSAAAEAKSLPADEQARIKAQLASLKKDCPVCSRMGETIGFVKSVLAHSLAVEEACGKHCPLAAAGPCPASEAKAARSKLLKDLDELAGHAAIVVSAECSARETTATASGPDSAERLAAKAAALKSSWEKAPLELVALPLERRDAIQASMKEIAGRSRAVSLLPETVVALGTGFEAIDALNGKLAEWAKANPEALKDVPEDARKAVEGQIALLRATRDVLQGALKCCGSACKTEKAETAASK